MPHPGFGQFFVPSLTWNYATVAVSVLNNAPLTKSAWNGGEIRKYQRQMAVPVVPAIVVNIPAHVQLKLGVKFILKTRVDGTLFEKLVDEYDYVVVAIGAHRPVIPPVKGKELLIPWTGISKGF
ncbi:MAG: hypothetical protein Q7J85_11700 [Bacillota bacterium]|nr:hypothetical protein [Bacillota bacterium]